MKGFFHARSSKTDPSAWFVQRDRFQIEDDEPAPPPEKNALPISALITDLCRKIETSSDYAVLLALQEHWFDLVGAPLAKHAWPARLDRQVLTIAVENSVWLSEVARIYGPRLLRRLQKMWLSGGRFVDSPHASDKDALPLAECIRRFRPVVDAATVRRNCPATS